MAVEIVAPGAARDGSRAGQGSPLLVTGMPRAGTSWVGKMVEAAGGFVYINEPLNPRHPPGGSPGVLDAPVRHRFQYISEANDGPFLQPFRDTLAFRYRYRSELRRNHSVPDLLRLVKHAGGFAYGRMRGCRPLLDDPYAVLSARWFAERLGCQVVVVVRHPAAVVASRLRLGWRVDFSELLCQPELMEDWLEPDRADMEALIGADDPLAEGALLWRVIHRTIEGLRDVPGLHVVRHEDLSLDPLRCFAELFERLGLPFGDEPMRQVMRSTSGQASERRVAWSLSRTGPSRTAYRPLDSRANAHRWHSELEPAQIDRIRRICGEIAQSFYTHEEWCACR